MRMCVHTYTHTVTLLKTLGRNERTHKTPRSGLSTKGAKAKREEGEAGAGSWAPERLPVVKECHLLPPAPCPLLCGRVAAPLTLAEHWNSHTSLSSRPELYLSPQGERLASAFFLKVASSPWAPIPGGRRTILYGPSSLASFRYFLHHPDEPSLSKKHALHGGISISLDFVHIPVYPIYSFLFLGLLRLALL